MKQLLQSKGLLFVFAPLLVLGVLHFLEHSEDFDFLRKNNDIKQALHDAPSINDTSGINIPASTDTVQKKEIAVKPVVDTYFVSVDSTRMYYVGGTEETDMFLYKGQRITITGENIKFYDIETFDKNGIPLEGWIRRDDILKDVIEAKSTRK